jgi:hypothetical protein
MSAGAFRRSKYVADYGDGSAVHPIRVQPETLSAISGTQDNDEPNVDITNPISAKISTGRRSLGLSPKFITLQLPDGTTPPTGYKAGSITRIPALTRAFYDSVSKGSEVTYLGVIWEVVSKTPERAT